MEAKVAVNVNFLEIALTFRHFMCKKNRAGSTKNSIISERLKLSLGRLDKRVIFAFRISYVWSK